MATLHLCRSNPEIFCDGSSYINTALDELPIEISKFLNIPDTLINSHVMFQILCGSEVLHKNTYFQNKFVQCGVLIFNFYQVQP
jgi:hypothetical protein